jgi:2-dehydro-3-deoxyphosphogluconate aldolase/(4S)-4-hydroxy-2-oxoglutarate aldolase
MRHEIVERILDCGAAAVIRMPDAEKLLRVAEAIREGGVTALEVTMTTPDALRVIEEVSEKMATDEDVLVGVGSVLDGETARLAINAGARFVVSPVFRPDLVEVPHRYDVPAFPGAFTPSEIQRAHEAGADVVKIFPAKTLGTGFVGAARAPMPHLKLMPTGGVTLDDAGDWLRAGACAVGVGSALLDKEAIARGDFAQLTENAKTLRRSILAARET